ncbi:MAG: M28 family peptidase [Myxococcota bacterium]
MTTLSSVIGERNLRDATTRANLQAAARFIEEVLTAAGHGVTHQRFLTEGTLTENLQVEIPGMVAPHELVVVGAHYDTAHFSPGADDNASGCAALLMLARALVGAALMRTLRLVFFVNEEPPLTRTPRMGSAVYAAACRRRRDRVRAMISLESLGFHQHSRRSLDYPLPLRLFNPLPTDDVAIVGNPASAPLVWRIHRTLSQRCGVASTRMVLPGFVPGVRSSDHWSFWQQGYPAVMITDTALLRYRHYHRATDTEEKLDYQQLARITSALEAVVLDLTR